MLPMWVVFLLAKLFDPVISDAQIVSLHKAVISQALREDRSSGRVDIYIYIPSALYRPTTQWTLESFGIGCSRLVFGHTKQVRALKPIITEFPLTNAVGIV